MLGHRLSQANVSAAHKHLIWLAHPGKLGQRQKIKACANALLKSWLRLMGQFFLITVLATVDAAERVPLFPGTTFLYINGAWDLVSVQELSSRHRVDKSNDDGDGNEDGKKAIGVDEQNNNSARTRITLFLYIFLASLHDYDVILLNFMYCGGREHKTTSLFLS